MKLATTTNDFDRYCKSYLDRVKYVHEAGFRYIDLSLYEVAENDPLVIAEDWQDTVAELKGYAAANGLQFVQCHAPNTNPLDPQQFERAVAWNLRSIAVCGALGISNMVIHSGWDKNAAKEEWFAGNKRFFEQLLDAAEQHHVNLLHENTTNANMHWFYPKTGAMMRDFSEFVNHPRFHSCWDTGHANVEGNQYEEILALGDDLYALHINDNRGQKDEHLIPYFGTVNMDDIMCALREINYQGVFTFESGATLRPQKYWLGNRRTFERETRLADPTLELQRTLEKFMYQVGKHILSAYDLFEE